MTAKLTKLFLLLQAVSFFQYSACFPLETDVSPCNLFIGEDDTDNTLFCDQKNTTLEQIKNALNSLEGQGTIELELYQVDLGVIPSDFFKGHNIKVLTIAFCDLQSLTGGKGRPLEGLENTLEVLMIKGSSINGREFGDSALSYLHKLTEIDFESNNFEEIGNDWFEYAPSSLRALILSNNKIQTLGDKAFANVDNLDFLSLSANGLTAFKRSMLPNPASKLWRLELDENNLSEISDDMFTNMPNLERVSLASNYISRIEENIWRPVWKQLTHMDFSDNPLSCDSDVLWIPEVPTCAEVTAECSNEVEFPLQREFDCS